MGLFLKKWYNIFLLKMGQGTMEQHKDSPVEIWAVGGGKGGTGKTFVICQLAVCLAAKGKRVVLIDADLGGANVHTFFGMRKPNRFITEFFDGKTELKHLMVDTDIKGLAIVPGNSNTIASANIKYAQKIKLFRHIRHLDADYILLDLGGGTSVDTIDTFLLADKLITVAVPEITAIENLYQFIKTTFFRRLKSFLADHGLKDSTREVWQNKEQYGIVTISDLINYLRTTSTEMNAILDEELAKFILNIIFNKVRNIREAQEGFSVKSVCVKYVGADARYTGYIEYDAQFWRNLSLSQSVPRFTISQSALSDVGKIVDNIINGDQMRIDNFKNV